MNWTYRVALPRKLAATLAVTTATLVLATPAPAHAQAARIDRITPAAARHGETVTINGNGFGATNVQIAVGGVRAAVLAANGHQVTFRVPDTAAPGSALVTATNPGGRMGSIAFRVLEGILLSGAPSAPADAATFDLPPSAVDRSQIERGVIMTRLDVRFAPGATVAQVNNALLLVQGGIVSMARGFPFVTIAIPRPSNVQGLQQIADTMKIAPGILWALVSSEAASQVLPTSLASFSDRHLLPTRFPAAWNAMQLATQGCGSRRVPVVVADNSSVRRCLQPTADFRWKFRTSQPFQPVRAVTKRMATMSRPRWRRSSTGPRQPVRIRFLTVSTSGASKSRVSRARSSSIGSC